MLKSPRFYVAGKCGVPIERKIENNAWRLIADVTSEVHKMARRVFIVSDLHLGATPASSGWGRGIFRAHQPFSHFVRWLRSLIVLQDEQVELVINGDFVDFLIEEEKGGEPSASLPWIRDELEANRKFTRIVDCAKTANTNLFGDLRDFVLAGGWLSLLLGNHDIELSLPHVRRSLAHLLGANSGRVIFVYDGEAYSVGRLLIEHGNRYDPWNRLDYDALRRERSLCSRGAVPYESGSVLFSPPPGTYLVTSFINRIKRLYPFVDVLKPETSLVIPLLIALEPSYRPLLDDLVRLSGIIFRRVADFGTRAPASPRRRGALSAGPKNNHPANLDELLVDAFGDNAQLFGISGQTRSGQLSSDSADSLIGKLQSVATFFSRGSSSFLSLLDSPQGVDFRRMRQLHLALIHLNSGSNCFSLMDEDPLYIDAARTLVTSSNRFDVVVFGHTHLPKRIPLGGHGQLYLNTGTWCEVLRLPEQALKDDQSGLTSLQEFIDAMKRNLFEKFLHRQLTFAEILVEDDGKATNADLWRFGGRGAERVSI